MSSSCVPQKARERERGIERERARSVASITKTGTQAKPFIFLTENLSRDVRNMPPPPPPPQPTFARIKGNGTILATSVSCRATTTKAINLKAVRNVVQNSIILSWCGLLGGAPSQLASRYTYIEDSGVLEFVSKTKTSYSNVVCFCLVSRPRGVLSLRLGTGPFLGTSWGIALSMTSCAGRYKGTSVGLCRSGSLTINYCCVRPRVPSPQLWRSLVDPLPSWSIVFVPSLRGRPGA